MSVLSLVDFGGYLAFDEQECRAAGARMNERYVNAQPFPHVVMDDFLDSETLRRVARSYPTSDGKTYFDRDQERLKFQYAPQESDDPLTWNLFAELNSRAFLGFLEELTSIRGLVSDPHFLGGGLHETKRGGHLGVHADFNIHPDLRLERRLNLLVYLNDDWDDEYGGTLELWDRQMSAAEVRVKPVMGRAVIFSTNLDSFHGHPDPLTCPPERSRRSIATYYYSALPEGVAQPERTTTFQTRPGSVDKTDWQVRRRHFINDWVPPRLQQLLRRIF